MTEEKKQEKKEEAKPKEAKVEAKEEAKAEESKASTKETSTVELSKESEELMKNIENMTVIELSNLVKALEERFGVSAAVPMMASAAGAAMSGAGEAEEKTSFTIVLTKIGDKKIQVIKEIRSITTLGLKEAKDLVESCPKPVKEDVSKEEAEEIKKKLEAVGAGVELK